MLEKLFNEIMTKVVRQISTREIYLDHAATTPHHPLVLQVMKQAMGDYYANPSAIHKKGTAVRQRIDSARAQVARLLGTTSNHIIFTRGGTESNTLAIMGVINYVLSHPQVTQGARPHVITSAIEHAVVLETLRELEAQELIQLSVIPVDREGLVLVEVIKQELRPETVLVSIMYANNEIGTIQPIKEIAKLLRWHRKQIQISAGGKSKMVLPLLHTDAIQAVNYLDVHVERLGVDFMSISGSKIYGPKSSGVLYVRNRDYMGKVFFGGDQEFGLRAGTEDVVQILGFVTALEIARHDAMVETDRLTVIRDTGIALLEKKIPNVLINGSYTQRLPNNINITIPGISGERLVIELDAHNIFCSTKSACKEDLGEASHVIDALRASDRASGYPLGNGAVSETDGAVRLSLGRSTTMRDMKRVIAQVQNIVTRIQAFESTLVD